MSLNWTHKMQHAALGGRKTKSTKQYTRWNLIKLRPIVPSTFTVLCCGQYLAVSVTNKSSVSLSLSLCVGVCVCHLPIRSRPVKTDECMWNVMLVISIAFTTQTDIAADLTSPAYSNKFTLTTFAAHRAHVHWTYAHKQATHDQSQ